ncbi:PepSY domain-containing protein [Pseudomonas fluorescens]|uniref:PepSY domain-containing protein n=1 Tax=Pseudomonas fluorescens TaxID=294 RepID=A0A944E129_PSEFL|nr:PepSY domain-containing protein [Pseudomonas fluorescens]MBT2296145.1 PepSY domain-containing protein [Pseudomonas fluorescens]MBT2308213.1 PepSY domain-containing protein [Pseudomonas fluorescens]MBT2313423.1 PepSY domain-containing protein [Pseudomonas fluorescens]MBT2320356.1 PepSY domain-containing protein [Pseudomonas fluorescens]MBT2330546.1 PepSY domain-containing protein [Pseudomonas fluorescens]
MNRLTAFFIAISMILGAGLAQARDLDADEAQKLQDAGTIQPVEKLKATALAQHPGATLTDAELEQEYGKYIFQVDLRDAKGIDWELELDAVTGKVLKNHQDL